MKGRQPGRPTKWVQAQIGQHVRVDRTGFSFVVWEKWKRVGTLTVSVGGLRRLPAQGRATRRRTWREVADWLSQ